MHLTGLFYPITSEFNDLFHGVMLEIVLVSARDVASLGNVVISASSHWFPQRFFFLCFTEDGPQIS